MIGGPIPELELTVTGRELEGPAMRPARSYWSESWARLRAHRLAMVAVTYLGIMVVLALSADLISHYVTHLSYQDQDLRNTFTPPGRGHWLGTDELGRDTLTRLLYGARVSMGVGFLTVALALTVGTAVGMAAGYYGGFVETALMRFVDVVLSIPSIFLFLLMAILFRPNAVTLSFIIASVGWAAVSRLVRGEVLSIKNRDFVLATRSLGSGDLRLILRHLIPNAMPVMIVTASLGVGQFILVEAALSFLGLGIQAPLPSWGNMLTYAQGYFFHSIYDAVFPGMCIFLTVLAANIFGNALRDAFDPRLK